MSFGADLGNSTIKVIALQRGLRGFAVSGAARRRVPRLKPEERKSTLMKLLYETLGGAGGKRIGVVGLSGRDINLQIVQQPATKAVNYRAMMGFELDQRRGSDDQLYADYCTLREPDQYFNQYLAMVGVGKRSYVDERLEIAKRAGLDVRDAVPNAFALYAAYKNAYGVEGGTCMVLDIGADNMDMALVRGGKLIYARNVSNGARLFDTNIAGIASVSPDEGEWLKIRYGSLLPAADNADPKEEEIRPAVRTAAGQLAGFIQSSMNHAKIEFGDRDLVIDKIYLSGGGARVRGFPEYLQSSLKVPIELFDPFKGLDTTAAEKLGLEEVRSLPTDMAVPVGLAQLALMPTEKSTLSILPDSIKARRNFFRTWSYVAAGGLALAVSLVVLTSVALVRKSTVTSKRQKFEADSTVQLARLSKLTQIEAEQRDVQAKIDRIAVSTLASRALLDVHAEVRDFAKNEEGITLREIRIVDPAKDGEGKRRCSFQHADLGVVVGEIEEKTPETIRVRMDCPPQTEARTFALSECVNVMEWDADARVIFLVGDVSAEPGKGKRLLDELKRRLTKEQRGQIALTPNTRDSDRPGWRRFEFSVICQARYE